MLDLVGNKLRQVAKEFGLLPLGEVLYLRGHLREVVDALRGSGVDTSGLIAVIVDLLPHLDARKDDKSWHTTINEGAVFIGDEDAALDAVRRFQRWCASIAQFHLALLLLKTLEDKTKSTHSKTRALAFEMLWTISQVKSAEELEDWLDRVYQELSPKLHIYGQSSNNYVLNDSLAAVLWRDPGASITEASDSALRELLRHELNVLLGAGGHFIPIPEDVEYLSRGLSQALYHNLSRYEKNFLLINLRLEEWKIGTSRYRSLEEALPELHYLVPFLSGAIDSSRQHTYPAFLVAPYYEGKELRATPEFAVDYKGSLFLGTDSVGFSVMSREGRGFTVPSGGDIGQRLVDGKRLLPQQVQGIEEGLASYLTS